jgi:hypothetical protein
MAASRRPASHAAAGARRPARAVNEPTFAELVDDGDLFRDLERIFPPNLKCEKPVKELNLLHKAF